MIEDIDIDKELKALELIQKSIDASLKKIREVTFPCRECGAVNSVSLEESKE